MESASGDSPGDFPTKMKITKLAAWMISQPTRVRGYSTTAALVMALGLLPISGKEEVKPDDAEKPPAVDVGTREELKLPGLTVYSKERYVDVDATVCLDAGFLELIACTKDSKEHESIISVDAKPSYIHAALLLLRAQPGNPSMAKKLEDGSWTHMPPSGSDVDASLVFKNEKGELKERPISDFIMRGQEEDVYGPDAVKTPPEERGRFLTSTFLFAGSQLYKGEDGKARYLSDQSGHVISLATFGDELLCLPGKHSHENSALAWEVDPTHLPALGTKVILRLRPKQPEQAAPDGEKKNSEP